MRDLILPFSKSSIYSTKPLLVFVFLSNGTKSPQLDSRIACAVVTSAGTPVFFSLILAAA
ncbi:hypothetical protein EGJ48_20715 [Pantoea dispersa]|nr:hypothetical protein EGJ48_20715 [Pantoea dispersa]